LLNLSDPSSMGHMQGIILLLHIPWHMFNLCLSLRRRSRIDKIVGINTWKAGMDC
jgi:hypothetical protein